MTTSPALAPVAESDRILGLDVARAVALLGIFFVNAVVFGEPFASIMDPGMPPGQSPLGKAFYWFTMVFCAGKFYPLFSLLFGVGLALQLGNARARGHGHVALFLRRLLVLGLFGAAHVLLLWPGDVLLIYATIGLWMLLLAPASPRTLLIVAGVVFTIGLFLGTGFALLGAMAGGGGGATPTPKPMPELGEAATALERWVAVLKDWNQGEQYDSRLKAIEIEIMRNGPLAHAATIRAFNYAFSWVYVIAVMFWVILPCFCAGAALLKSGFFHGQLRAWRGRFIVLGLAVGLPLNIFAAWAVQQGHGSLWMAAATLAMSLGGPLMSLMYLSLVLNWVDSGAAAAVARALARLGQMGLSGYILESVLMSAIMLHWGLGQFGSTTWAQRGLYVLGIYAIILVIANIWMRLFRFGPLEWLWRSLTYLRPQPMVRVAGQ